MPVRAGDRPEQRACAGASGLRIGGPIERLPTPHPSGKQVRRATAQVQAGRNIMIARCVCTLVTLLLAFYAFWGNALGAGHIFNPFGLLFLLLAATIWFKWEMVKGSFSSVKAESNIPILRMGYKAIQGLFGGKTPDSTPPERSSGNG
jgi:hypothetical protein